LVVTWPKLNHFRHHLFAVQNFLFFFFEPPNRKSPKQVLTFPTSPFETFSYFSTQSVLFSAPVWSSLFICKFKRSSFFFFRTHCCAGLNVGYRFMWCSDDRADHSLPLRLSLCAPLAAPKDIKAPHY
jgi:hypothetical protein